MDTPFEHATLKLSPEQEARIKELQALITPLQLRADEAKDEDIREALNLQISKLGLKVARLKRGQPEELPSEIEAEPEDDVVFEQATPEQIDEADRLIQRAMLEKRRGNKQGAIGFLQQAEQAAPNAASVLVAIGDNFLERRQFAAAQEKYRAALKLEPKNTAIERKLAELSMTGMAGMSVEEALRRGSYDSPFIQQDESLANPTVAIWLSAIVPGAGQFAMGRQRKAIWLFAIFVVSLALFVVFTKTLLPPAPLDPNGHELPRPKGQALPTWAYFPIVVAVLTWIIGLADAATSARIGRQTPGARPNKPAPPVNLPFE